MKRKHNKSNRRLQFGTPILLRGASRRAARVFKLDRIGNFTSNCLRNAWAQFEANELNEYVSITNHPDHPTHQNHPNHPNHLNPSYDPDGNLLTNGVWSYAYDARNRLTTVWSNDLFVLENRYDFASRRVLKRTPAATHRYYYDGWNPVCEIVVSGNATNRIDYFWGKDLSGSLQGAGGVGGLLAVRTGDSSCYPAYDNNGNIVAYADDSGAVVASYAYDAFGNTKESSGPLSDFFVHRFSTKSLDPETSLYYYGYRFYAPVLGRWMNRDPIEERGGVNLFDMCCNTTTTRFDSIGLFSHSDDCSFQDEVKIRSAESWALVRLQQWVIILDQLYDGPLENGKDGILDLFLLVGEPAPSLEEYGMFVDKLKHIRDKLTLLRDKILNNEYAIECECDCSSTVPGVIRQAYVYDYTIFNKIFARDHIHFCKDFYDSASVGAIAEVLIHELSHMFLDTQDPQDVYEYDSWEFSGNIDDDIDQAMFFSRLAEYGKSKYYIMKYIKRMLKGELKRNRT